ncbi:hypothetical protein [Paramagnetospirillum magneticum]|uniref:Uncharacterized protein n=1 Tax=Paramagnetospirillum magneticum (strain ATCC 700264 / AMB-1) TaxID=342108 RepID=Q2WAQ3_PARM1|nr:hypothetical protein [Paramagnetospirillum magneticum]BAE49072.1 hypothetical protein amb0268 [Paramagnetospirillum magneticum AMB-1]
MTPPPPTDLAGERLVRKTPDCILPLDQGDQDYIRAGLEAVQEAFGIAALPDVPLGLMPGRTLMRLLVDLRARLRPRSPEQTSAWGRLAGAILILDMAGEFASQHSQAEERRRAMEHDDLED